MHKQNTYEQLGLPAHIGEILFVMSLVLTLSPYLSGADFGIFRVPAFPDPIRKHLKLLGPILLAASTLLFFPFWPEPVASPNSADDPKISVLFHNSSDRRVNLAWLNYKGKPDRKVRFLLRPGDTKELDTYLGHVWLFSDAKTDEVLRTVTIEQNTHQVDFQLSATETPGPSP
jgi:VHL beta domain